MTRIFIGLTEITGYYSNLKYGFDELGIESIYVDLSNHPFKYGGDSYNTIVRLLQSTKNKYLISLKKSRLIFQVWWLSLHFILRIFLFIWAITKFDVFIFGYHTSFFYLYDLPILKAFSKKIIYVFHGSDSRPPYIDGALIPFSRRISIQDCIQLTSKQKQRLKKIERYADIIISHPLSSQLHEKRFLSFFVIGLPYNLQNITDPILFSRAENTKIRILHSPSDLEVKGTYRIREVIQNLQAKGYPIDFIEITGKPNKVVLDELTKCDFVVDQLYSDTPLAGFAAEAAFFGKPAIVSGYAFGYFKEVFPPKRMPTSYYCHPNELEAAIERFIIDREYRLELGKQAQHFVRTHWTPKKVAECYIQIIEGSIEDWMSYNPSDIRYVYGVGLPEKQTRELIKGIIEKGGKAALQLSDKPELERVFIEFAGMEIN